MQQILCIYSIQPIEPIIILRTTIKPIIINNININFSLIINGIATHLLTWLHFLLEGWDIMKNIKKLKRLAAMDCLTILWVQIL